jgi:hypothetical protein
MSEAQAQSGQGQGDGAAAAAAAAAAANAGTQNGGQQANNGQAGGQQNNGQQANGQNGAQSGQGGQTNGASGTVAAGATEQQQQNQQKPYWPEDWREKIAEHVGAGDKKAVEKELRRLQNLDSPLAVYGSFRNMENTWASKQFIKLPGKDAKPEELAEYNKAMGVPEKPEDYFKSVKLENGAVIGDADKPMVDSFAQAAHKAGLPPAAVNTALNWYFGQQEAQAAALDDADDKFKGDAQRALKDEWGGAFKRRTNAVATLFDIAPGGPDVKNPNSLYARLLGGRTADGRVIGDDPDIVRWLSSLAHERNPAATVVEDGDMSGKSVENEIAAIEKTMRENRTAYNKDTNMQARYKELLGARDKIRAKAR